MTELRYILIQFSTQSNLKNTSATSRKWNREEVFPQSILVYFYLQVSTRPNATDLCRLSCRFLSVSHDPDLPIVQLDFTDVTKELEAEQAIPFDCFQ